MAQCSIYLTTGWMFELYQYFTLNNVAAKTILLHKPPIVSTVSLNNLSVFLGARYGENYIPFGNTHTQWERSCAKIHAQFNLFSTNAFLSNALLRGVCIFKIKSGGTLDGWWWKARRPAALLSSLSAQCLPFTCPCLWVSSKAWGWHYILSLLLVRKTTDKV